VGGWQVVSGQKCLGEEIGETITFTSKAECKPNHCEALWVVTLCSVVGWYQHFGEKCCLHFHGWRMWRSKWLIYIQVAMKGGHSNPWPGVQSDLNQSAWSRGSWAFLGP
jgi:hypothetical protein